MKDVYTTCMALVRVEEVCLDIKKALTDGSALKGHTPKTYDRVDMHAVRVQLALLALAVESLEERVAE